MSVDPASEIASTEDSVIVTTAPEEAPAEVMLVTSEPIESPSAAILTSTWSEVDLPTFLGRRLLLLEVPPGQRAYDQVIADVEQAQLAGATVVWLVNSRSPVEVLKTLAGGEVHALRKPFASAECVVADKRFEKLFARGVASDVHFAFSQSSHNLMPVAFIGTERLGAALTKTTLDATTVIVPAPALTSAYATYADVCRMLALRASPLQQHTRAIWRVLVILGLLTACITALRYRQRDYNRQYIDYTGSGAITDRPGDDLTDFLNGFRPALLRQLLKRPETTAAAHDDVSMVRIAARLGLYAEERLHFQHILRGGMRDEHYVEDVEPYINEVAEEVSTSMAAGLNQEARFRAQQFLNAAETIPPSNLLASLTPQLNRARKTVDLVDANVLVGSAPPALLDAIFTNDWESVEMPDMSSIRPANPLLEDNVAYTEIALRSGEADGAERAQEWRMFALHYPASELVDEAAINEIASLMESSGSADANHEKAIALCESFHDRFPYSYLIDDALYYELRMAGNVDNGKAMWSAAQQLARIPKSDKYRQWVFVMRTLWHPRMQETLDGLAVAEFVTSTAALDIHSPVRETRWAGEPETIAAIVAYLGDRRESILTQRASDVATRILLRGF